MQVLEQGTGNVQLDDAAVILTRQHATTQQYSNAQIHDYGDGLLHSAPLQMSLQARFSHPIESLKGTAGFGFWNAPFAPGSKRLRLPRTAWFFFGSPPLDIALAMDVPSHGFKVATMDAIRPLFFALLPTAPLGFLLMRVPFVYRRLWRVGQHALAVSEKALSFDITTWHTYRLDWQTNGVRFWVDDVLVHQSRYSPNGKMGFVAWIDNQYAVVTPQGRFGWGLIPELEAQTLELKAIEIAPIPPAPADFR